MSENNKVIPGRILVTDKPPEDLDDICVVDHDPWNHNPPFLYKLVEEAVAQGIPAHKAVQFKLKKHPEAGQIENLEQITNVLYGRLLYLEQFIISKFGEDIVKEHNEAYKKSEELEKRLAAEKDAEKDA